MTSPSATAPGSSDCHITSSVSPSAETNLQHVGQDGAVSLPLTFSDTPTGLPQLGVNTITDDNTDKADQPKPLKKILSRPPTQPPPSTHDGPTSSPSTPPVPIQHSRRPSPGLAARLKALGFGTRKSNSPTPSHHPDSVGRLPEEQLRKLDEGHQLKSAAPTIERRGRPWKGLVRIPSRSSLKSNKSHKTNEEIIDEEAASEVKPEFLPEIVASKPLEMDTLKYRLPDHTNGNGVKVQRETREEHLARESRRPSSADKDLPPLPPKDTPPLEQGVGIAYNSNNDVFSPDAVSYFNPLGLQRPGSIYTLSRASFANQLAQLTSLQLPDAGSLSSRVSAIPTAQAAASALIGAADQIRGWIYKASEVIGGLESDDDVEWAAAGGREGVEEVENAIARFGKLMKVYVSATEELHERDDINSVPPDDLQSAVAQMESILHEWAKIHQTLHHVKAQVEIAMEWEELWNVVLGDIQNEMDELSRLVFEMEERRHKSLLTVHPGDGADYGDLETIVEETPPNMSRLQPGGNRFSLLPFPASPSSPSPISTGISQDDSSLLALFARMQPLKASLDFLPMRLEQFKSRAENIFPTAWEELEMRRTNLEASCNKLEKDADSLRKELGEDRWIIVFRNAGRQAQKMYESVDRSVARLREAIDGGMHLTNQPVMTKKIESYEAKKTHYGPAVERVLSIIDKGVKDRLTVNGEILRLHNEMQAKWGDLKERMAELDFALEEIQADRKGQQLRDSISSMLSNDRSTLASGNETPQSSPPSSVIMSSMGLVKPVTVKPTAKPRAISTGSHLPQPSNRRLSSLPTPAHQIPRKALTPRVSALSTPGREGSTTPTGNRPARPGSTVPGSHKPRWNGSTNTSDVDTGHNFKPLTLTTPSPYAKRTPTPVRSVSALTPSSTSKLPTIRSPLSRAGSSSPVPEDTPSKLTPRPQLSFRERLASSPGPYSQQALSKTRLSVQGSGSDLASRRASLQPPRLTGSSSDITPRSASSMAVSRRTSLLPQPRAQSKAEGRESPQALAGARFAMRKNSSTASTDGKSVDNKPRWRG
ncbi:cortical protein KAR9-domain-containing protein [Rhypophila decipiens]|uniref:Cortical protein KAR9-domain-containing protein n=1 Tax=Rhypophila decipiens TaxID=261697 RepID=A0AAN7BE50_9PEZI|nr:cortical protein KAR9-domain-containing protein [Rhypophila decipiens]